jgi:hypothetical protein
MTREEAINYLISDKGIDTNQIRDGYHSFGELYEHRITLFIALCKVVHYSNKYEFPVWKSKSHSDRSKMEGWFIMGISFKKGDQITYHLPISYWEKCWFAKEYEAAPDYDGHTSEDVLRRLMIL